MYHIAVNTPKWSWHSVCISIHSFSDSTLDMDPIFGAISAVDHADCGKLLVCNVVAKTQNELTTEEDLLGKVIYPKYTINTIFGQLGCQGITELCIFVEVS